MKYLSKFSIVTLACLLLIGAFNSAQAASFIEFFFPMLKADKPNVAKNMRAPFADTEVLEEREERMKKGLPVNDIPLSEPHRMAPQIGIWLRDELPVFLSFDGGKVDDSLAYSKLHFSGRGYETFQAFLKKFRIQDILDDGRFDVKTIVRGEPLLLNKGTVSDHYFWAFQVPVMLTYLDKNMTNYRQIDVPKTQDFILTIQIRRTAQSGNDHDVVIEQWQGKPPR